MRNIFESNKTTCRLIRTIIQGVIGVIIANLDLIFSGLAVPPEYKPLIVALVMAILSPVMAMFTDNDKPVEVVGVGEYEEAESEEEIKGE